MLRNGLEGIWAGLINLIKSNFILFLLFLATFFVLAFQSSTVTPYNLSCMKDDYKCFEKSLLEIMNDSSVKTSLKVLDSAYSSGNISSNNCHLIAHELGWASARKNGIHEALLSGSSVCRFGYYHGVFEYGAQLINSTSIPSLCSREESRTELDRLQCLHGLGHGLMIAADYNISLALSECSELLNGYEQEYCATGIYHESFQPGHPGYSTLDSNFSDPFKLCYLHDYPNQCFLYVGISILRRHNSSFSKSLSACDGAPPDFILLCKRGIGIQAARFSNYDPNKVIEDCENNQDCLFGAASDFGVSQEFIKGLAFCTKVSFPEIPVCFAELLYSFSKEYEK